MHSEVKMPQLGMNQDSAIIVAWLKAAGDAVATGDVLFEVETDKSTVEVEAAADGFLSGIRAPEGADVPVGDVIAMIVETAADVEAGPAPEPAAEPEPEPKPKPAPEPTPAAAPVADPPPVPAPREAKTLEAPVIAPPTIQTGKVLASPLAKQLAAKHGIDLASLRAGGLAEPLHAADVKEAGTGGQSQLSARVDGGALTALLQRSAGANRAELFAAFAVSAWGEVFQGDAISVAIRTLDGAVTQHPAATTAGVALTLLDLCDTRLNSFSAASGGITLVAARDGDAYVATLSFSEAQLPLVAAVALLDAIAARVEDPIRQLL